MFDINASYKSVNVKIGIEKLAKFPYFVNPPSSFSISPYAFRTDITVGGKLVLIFYGLVSMRVYWMEYPAKKKLDGNIPIEIKRVLPKELGQDEGDFIIKTITSYMLSFQSVEAIEKKNVVAVPYVVKSGEDFVVFLFGEKIGSFRYMCQENKCEVFLDGKRVDTIEWNDDVSSRFPQIHGFLSLFLDAESAPSEELFFTLSKKYAVLLLRRKIIKVKSALFS